MLSEHLRSYFRDLGLDTVAAVGIEDAAAVAREEAPDIVICDYDLLATHPLDDWETDARLSQLPIVAVSLTRRPEESHALDVNGIAGFLYLPTLHREAALRVLPVRQRTPRIPSLPRAATAVTTSR
ncbi:MAG: hypothetical protein NVS1B4_21920 [Gemmatimonadaceae bacterium]